MNHDEAVEYGVAQAINAADLVDSDEELNRAVRNSLLWMQTAYDRAIVLGCPGLLAATFLASAVQGGLMERAILTATGVQEED